MRGNYKMSSEVIVLEKSKMAFIINYLLIICTASIVILVPIAIFAKEFLGVVSIIWAFTIFIAMIVLPFNYRNISYMLSGMYVLVCIGKIEYSIPLSDLTIVNEETIRTNNPKYGKIIIESNNIQENRSFTTMDLGLIGM